MGVLVMAKLVACSEPKSRKFTIHLPFLLKASFYIVLNSKAIWEKNFPCENHDISFNTFTFFCMYDYNSILESI